MSLPSITRLTPHFTAYELGADRPEAAPYIVSNLYTVASFLETVRAELGVPLQVNTPAQPNRGFAPRPDNENSSHPLGLAADFVPLGFQGGMLAAYDALKAARDARRLPPFDQIIFYPYTGHIHVGLGARLRGEFRVALAEGGYPLITSDTIKALGRAGFVSSPLILLLLVIAGIVLLIA